METNLLKSGVAHATQPSDNFSVYLTKFLDKPRPQFLPNSLDFENRPLVGITLGQIV